VRRTVRPVGVLLALAAASGVWLAAQPAVDSHHLALLRARSPVGLSVAISVAEPGLYRIDRATLEGAGFAVHDIDPRRLHLSLHGEPVAMHVTGEADGRLDADDTLLFYGTAFRGRRLASLFRDAMVRTGPVDNWLWQCQGECRLEGVFEKYTTTSRYRLEVLETPGLRMSSQPLGDPERASVPRESVRETALHDTAQFWWSFAPRSEDTWFSDWISGRFVRPVDGGPGAPIERTYTVDVPSPDAQGDDATIRAMFASVASAPGTPDYHVAVTFNGHVLGTVTWDGRRAEHGHRAGAAAA
jgi:hypothetical protein